ncbi:MAG: co-chaperone GroES [Firmicutes bacterium]|nr:co-chaperone GroES [Bacillota bacterium]
MAIKPLLDKVVIKLDEEKSQKTSSGIILTPKSKDQSVVSGKVVSRGPGGMIDGREVKMYVEEGDTIIAKKYACTEIKVENEEYAILRQSDILALIC